MLEKDFQRQVVEYAKLKGWLIHHDLPSQRGNGKWTTHTQGDPGFPDLVLVKPAGPTRIISGIHIPQFSRIVFAELKGPKGKVKDHQQRWLDAIGQESDVQSHVWRPDDWHKVQVILS